MKRNLPHPADIRRTILGMIYRGGASHLGTSMSMVEILTAAYGACDTDAILEDRPDRDRVFVSKGHGAACTYAVLHHYGLLDAATIDTYHRNESALSGHVSHAVPHVEHSTGALGHGLPVAVGTAVGLRSRGFTNALVFCVLGDGEIQEGSVWEALMLASHLKLSKLIPIIDNNRISSIKATKEVLNMEPLADRFKGFGFVVHQVDGHDVSALSHAIENLKSGTQPGVIIADTVKGKGVPFAENQPIWHYRSLNEASYNEAIKALEGQGQWGRILETLRHRMAEDKTLFFLTGDMGINLVEVIEEAFPDRFLNVGIAEQNLIGVAAGLCNVGFRPVVYTISNFLVHRCFEQVRNDICLHEYPVILLGTSAGFDNAPLGPTHHIVDEWGALKGLPGMQIFAPASVQFAATVLDKSWASGKPTYIRVPKGTPNIPAAADDVSYLPGKTNGPLLISYGTLASECLKVQAQQDNVSLLILNRVHPIDAAAVEPYLAKHQRVLVVEDHFGPSGLYGSLCQLVVEQHLPPSLESIAPPHEYDLVVGQSGEIYHRRHGLDAAGIVRRLAMAEHSEKV